MYNMGDPTNEEEEDVCVGVGIDAYETDVTENILAPDDVYSDI